MSSPAFQFYPADYLSDARVQALSIEGEGCYIRLMCYCWREGSVPNDRAAIVKLCKGYDGPGIDEAILLFVRGRKPGSLIHKRIEKERKRQKERAKLMHDAGLRGAKARWGGHSHPNGIPMASDSSSSSSSSSTSVNKPPNPLLKRGNRKQRQARIGDNADPRYVGASQRNKERFPELRHAEGKRGDEEER